MGAGLITPQLSDIVVLRLATADVGGTALARLKKDILALVGEQQPDSAIERAIHGCLADALIMRDEAEPRRSRVTAAGSKRAAVMFGERSVRQDWKTVATRHLIARSLGWPANAGSQRLKRLDTVQGLRIAILRKHYDLKIPEHCTVGQIRNALAFRALADVFGKDIRGQLPQETRLSGKAGRAIATQLLKKKRRVASDALLIAALAAEAAEAEHGDLRSLRQALISKLLPPSKKQKSRVDPATLDRPKSPAERALEPKAFIGAVRSSAKLNANGWSGNRKAYISHVWRSVRDSHPEWRLSELSFKKMLAEAHRDGELVLVNADLRDRKNMRDIQESTVQYKNMEWHFVRIAD